MRRTSASLGNSRPNLAGATEMPAPGPVRPRLLMSCGIAKRPIKAVRKLMPDKRSVLPNVKRAVPMTGSWPIDTMARPMSADNSPLTHDLAANEQMTVKPSSTRLNKSGARKPSAMSARRGAIKNRHNALNSPPRKLARTAIPSARPASPRATIGCPSSAVAAADGVPGMLSMIAAKLPPSMPPT